MEGGRGTSTELLDQPGGAYRHLQVNWDGRLALAINEGATQGDFLLQRPAVHPLNTPRGLTVTEASGPGGLHHRGIWIGHGNVNGANCFHDGAGQGRIVVLRRTAHPAGRGVRIEYQLEWVNAQGLPLLEERRAYRFLPEVPGRAGFSAHRLDVTSTVFASHGPATLARDARAYCGVRLAAAIADGGPGVMQNSAGQRGAAAVSGLAADWLDASGPAGPRRLGIAVLVHPSCQPAPLQVSGDLITVNPFLHAGRRLADGEQLTCACSFFAHDGDATDGDVAGAFARFRAEPLA